MSSHRNILFIINPASGTSHRKPDAEMITCFFKNTDVHPVVTITDHPGQASDFTKDAVQQNYDAVIAVGGDGTVNEVARELVHTPTALGIIPCGSGNGLARHHKVPFNHKKALEVILNNKPVNHDAVRINNHLSFNVSGIGFDAHVAHLFGKNGKRGFSSYVKLVLKEFSNYRESLIEVEINGITTEYNMMLTAIANASQFGNNARIAPLADTNDGLVDISVVRKMGLTQLPEFFYRVFTGNTAKSPHAVCLQQSEYTITCKNALPLHVDGEPCGTAHHFRIAVIPSAFKFIKPIANVK